MTHVLHFSDYSVDRRLLERWFKSSIPEQIESATQQHPLLFVDSGGYRLLYNSGLDIERYGLRATVEDILRLQARFGGDIVATLDFPIPPRLEEDEARTRINKSIENCVKTLRLSKRILDDGFMVHLAVHGRSRLEARSTVEKLFRRLRNERLNHVPMGVAIGSLVPLASSPLQVIEIVRGVTEGIHACSWLDPLQIPIHAFGVSSRMIPLLAALGVDSFDGTTYVQYAQSLKYLQPGTFSPRPFLALDSIDCSCSYCQVLRKGGLDIAQQALTGPSYRALSFAGSETNKSYIYALIALHNLEASLDVVGGVREATKSETALEKLLVKLASDGRMRRNLAYLLQFFPDATELLWEVGVARLKKRLPGVKSARHFEESSTEPIQTFRWPKEQTKADTPAVSLALGPNDFDIRNSDFELQDRPILLLLPCSQQKPYSRSPSHRLVRKALEEAGLKPSDYSKVTISGNYGPVPEEYESDARVQMYDFYLSSGDRKRIFLLVERTRSFVKTQKSHFKWVVAYVTSKPYREVMEQALQGIQGATILPESLRARRSAEFKKPENMQRLVRTMTRLAKEKGA